MAFAKLDIHFDEHPKFHDLGLNHLGLLACMISYANRLLTDGFVPTKALLGFGQITDRSISVARKLVASGVLDEVQGGYRIVGFLDHNPSKEEVESRQLSNRYRQDKFRKSNKKDSDLIVEDVADVTRYVTRDKRVTHDDRNALLSRCSNAQVTAPDPDPDPDPDQKEDPPVSPPRGDTGPRPGVLFAEPEPTPAKTARTRGSRLTEDWRPAAAVIERFATRECVDAMASFERFQNYWLTATGRNAAKIDWDRTFTNWVLEDVARGRSVPYEAPKPPPKPKVEEPATLATAEDTARLTAEIESFVAMQTPRLLRNDDADCGDATAPRSDFRIRNGSEVVSGSENRSASKFGSAVGGTQ